MHMIYSENMTILRNKIWTCPFSGVRNSFPPKYAEHISERPPPEMLYPTVDYILPVQSAGVVAPPSFLFVVDTCLFEEELDTLKDSLQQVGPLKIEKSLTFVFPSVSSVPLSRDFNFLL